MTGSHWRVRLSEPAREDIRGIFRWTSEQFGSAQAEAYQALIEDALARLSGGPTAAGVRERADVSDGLYTLHISRRGQPARHLILFRADGAGGMPLVRIGRVLHDSMDIVRHLPADEDG